MIADWTYDGAAAVPGSGLNGGGLKWTVDGGEDLHFLIMQAYFLTLDWLAADAALGREEG